MICTCIQNKSFDEILEILSSNDVEMAEIRLDACHLSLEEIEVIFNDAEIPLIATCRISDTVSSKEASKQLEAAIRSGAAYADVELNAPYGKRIKKICPEYGTRIIQSYHNFENTPGRGTLEGLVRECLEEGDIAKIVTTVNNSTDCDTLTSLYPNPGLIAFGMGTDGAATRLDCLRLGAPFTYCSYQKGEETAPGQMTAQYLRRKLGIDSFTHFTVVNSLPSSKSYAQRAIVASALADGTSKLFNYSPCKDSESAIEVAKAIGAKVAESSDYIEITGIGSHNLSIDSIFTGESALLTRLMVPVLGAKNYSRCLVNGEKSLVGRALTGLTDILRPTGIEIESQNGNDSVPLHISGKLHCGNYTVSGGNSSQIISGLLMGLPLVDGDSTLTVSDPKSIPYLFITKDILAKFGIEIGEELEGYRSLLEDGNLSGCSKITYTIKGNQHYLPAEFSLERDWSSAAYLMIAGAVFGGAVVKGLDIDSLQGDKKIIDILVEAGAAICQYEDGSISVRKAPLEAFETDLNNYPDLFPAVALLASFCQGESVIHGTGRLVSKESNRAIAICDSLSKLGIEVSVNGDAMMVCGETLISRICNSRILKGGRYSSFHDHRIAMMLTIASKACEDAVVIDDTECIAKSFPEFLDIF